MREQECQKLWQQGGNDCNEGLLTLVQRLGDEHEALEGEDDDFELY